MFFFRFLRLIASVLWEGVCNGASLAAFGLFRRRDTGRAHVRELMTRAGALLVVAAVLLPATTGCTTFPGASFERQIDQTVWSMRVMTDASGEFDGLVSDILVLTDPEWGELPSSLEQLGW